uniref:ABC transporter domain-containing protein n=1 Tax=Macrostomum lignano TaxID=282301 RepID=A0A1I8FN34_9PLAT
SSDADRLKEAHEACNNRAYEAMSCGKSPVIVDKHQCAPLGVPVPTSTWPPRFGYVLLLVVPKTPWRFDASAARQSRHAALGAPRDHRAAAVQLGGGAPHLLRLVPAVRRLLPACSAWPVTSSTAWPPPPQAHRKPLPQLPAGVATAEPPVPASSGRRSKSRKQRSASPPQSPAPPLLHATAKFCGRRGASQQELVSQIDYHNRPDVQAALGRVFCTAVSAICVTTRDRSPRLPAGPVAGPRHHSNGAPGAAKQAGLDLLAALQQAARSRSPGRDEARPHDRVGLRPRLRPDTCLLTLDEPIALDTILASAY